MNREILFRGKHDRQYTDRDEWIYGVPYNNHYHSCIMATDNYKLVVTAETVGQYTGLNDKNGVKIFEGDIIKHKENFFEIKYSTEQARYLAVLTNGVFNPVAMQNCEVVGNVFDNSELLEIKENELKNNGGN